MRFSRIGSFGSLNETSKVGRLYSSILTYAFPESELSRRQPPRRRPDGTTNSPAAVPKSFVVAVALSTLSPFGSTSVTVTGVRAAERNRASSAAPSYARTFQ